MELYEYIFKRKSTRKYNMTPLDKDTLAKITDFADNLKPLFPDIKTQYQLVTEVKNILPVKSPHYFLITSDSAAENTGDYLHNIGFMWQQMDLYISSLGLGSCWLGMAKPTSDTDLKYPFVIALAFGKPDGSPYREYNTVDEKSEFKRKPLSEISSGNDSRVEAARLSPSATNSQHWFFDANDGEIDVYQKKLTPLLTPMYDKMNKIDMGIALCHLYIATKHNNNEFTFQNKPTKYKKGYIYTGTVKYSNWT